MKLNPRRLSRQSKNLRLYVTLLIFVLSLILLIKNSGIFTNLFSKDFFTDFSYPLEGDILKYIHQIKSGMKPDVDPINSYDYPFILLNKSKCGINSKDKITLLILIKSSLTHRNKREAIRKTWGQEKRFSYIKIRTAFSIGISPDENEDLQNEIKTEHEKYGDLIQSEFVDSYYNNTVKIMQSIRWVVEKCSNVEFVLFSDDDMYISVKNLLSFVKEFKNQGENRDLFTGCVFKKSPIRNEFSKWYISLDEYPYSHYPPFVNAGAFLVSYKTLLELFYGSMYTQHLRFDDVFLGLVAYKINVSLTDNIYFHNWKMRYSKYKYQPVIACHGYDDPGELVKVWNEQNSFNFA